MLGGWKQQRLGLPLNTPKVQEALWGRGGQNRPTEHWAGAGGDWTSLWAREGEAGVCDGWYTFLFCQPPRGCGELESGLV